MTDFNTDFFQKARKNLTSALLADILDSHGFRQQVLSSKIKPVDRSMIVAGKVMTVLGEDIAFEDPRNTTNPYGLLFDALDALQQDEVFLYSGGLAPYAIWGGLTSVRAMRLKAAGAVINGGIRDTNEISELNFPTFSRQISTLDQKSRGLITDYRCLIEIDGISIQNGDLIFGDYDGVVIVPQHLADEIFEEALDKSSKENHLRNSLVDGMSSKQAYEKYGIF